jgi:hypothetical protein
MTFRTRLKALLVVCISFAARNAKASDEPGVPAQLQAELTAKVVEYVKEPHVGPADVIHIGILTKVGRADSMRFGSELKAALDRIQTVAGAPHEQSLLTWSNARALADECRRRHLLVVYVAPGLDTEMPDIARSLQGIQLLTVGASDSYVSEGCILGFELLSGHPKMVFNQGQATRQNVVFRSALMRLMRIVE